MMTTNCTNTARLAAVAGIALSEAMDRINARHLGDVETLGSILLDALQRRGLSLEYAKLFSLDFTQPLSNLLRPKAE